MGKKQWDFTISYSFLFIPNKSQLYTDFLTEHQKFEPFVQSKEVNLFVRLYDYINVLSLLQYFW